MLNIKNKNEAKKVSEISEETKNDIITTTVEKFRNIVKKDQSLFDDNKNDFISGEVAASVKREDGSVISYVDDSDAIWFVENGEFTTDKFIVYRSG